MNSVDREESVSKPNPSGRPEMVFVVPSTSRGQKIVLGALGAALVVSLGVVAYLMNRLSEAEQETSLHLERFERQLQRLDAGITFDSRRQRLLLGMRDEIMRVNPTIGLHDAYRYAEYVLRASDKYPTFSPLLLLAIGIVESGFRGEAVSPANARGLYQIMPSTGRLLARGLGWEYSKDLLLDPARNTEMAALYLDILFATYNDPSLVLAEYNGGPHNAGLFRANASKTAAETRDYVPKVLAVYERLRNDLEHGAGGDRQALSMYRSLNRRGKSLGAIANGETAETASMTLLDD